MFVLNQNLIDMKIAVIGSRSFSNSKLVDEELSKVLNKVTLIVSGGAKGADTLAENWANSNNLPTKIFLPDFKNFAGSAYFVRKKNSKRM